MPANMKPVARATVFHSEWSATSAIITHSSGTVGPQPIAHRMLSQNIRPTCVGPTRNTSSVATRSSRTRP